MPLTKSKERVVALAAHQLPFETWRPIFQIVYATKNSISHPPCDFELSPLHSRLNVYRNLALVSKAWRMNARDVFFEELQAHTTEALKGIIQTFLNDRSLALAVSRISFSFWAFRCSASLPRRPRPLLPATAPEAGLPGSPGSPDWKTIHRRDARLYQPSTVSQGKHWTRWQADIAQILTMCSSLSDVDITFTSSYIYHHPDPFHSHANYREFFAPPDLYNGKILEGLLCSPNLRKLDLVDPAPLQQYGPALVSWTRLKHMSITLTRSFDELQDTAFIPPKSLTSFRFHDMSHGKVPWPLASDLASCDNLQVLDLGVTTLTNGQTLKAISFLCTAYQHSLRELTLEIIQDHSHRHSHEPIGFQQIFMESRPALCFPKLERLRLLGTSCDTSIFSSFKTEILTYVEVGWLSLEPFTGSREDKWSKGLGYPSLSMLKELVINQGDPDHLRAEALQAVCERLGIKLQIGRASGEEAIASE